jgi:hypothetical protein
MIYAVLLTLLLVSVAGNVMLFWYCRTLISKCWNAAEAASEIFTRFDAYKKHLQDVYQLRLFYGDRNLKEILEHTTDLLNFLKQYEAVYSFTQPDLEEILAAEDKNDETTNEETK